MRSLRLRRRPSAATVISLIALVFAMGGSAVAATGGTFLLGKANTASRVSSLRNTRGTALSLTSTAKAPPLTVSNSVQIPHLDASELGGHPAADYPISGAVDASVNGGDAVTILHGPASAVIAVCDPSGPDSGAALEIQGETGAASDQTAVWWNPGGVGSNTALQAGVTQFVLTDVGTSGPDMVVVQVDNHSTITTYTVTELYDIFLCRFYGQVVTTKG